MLIPRPKIHSLDRVLSRGQTLEIPYIGRDGQKISRGGRKVSRGGRKIIGESKDNCLLNCRLFVVNQHRKILNSNICKTYKAKTDKLKKQLVFYAIHFDSFQTIFQKL